MIRSLLLVLVLISTHAFAAIETPVITHSKMIPRTILRTGFWGFLEVVGKFEKIVDNRVVVSGQFQFRVGEGNWTNVTPTSRVSSNSSTVNYRRFDFSDMTGSSFDLRVCLEGQCSKPYIIYFAPRLLRVLTPSDGIITPFSRNLRFSLIHHQLGGVRFYIGKLDPYPGSSEIFYGDRFEIDPGDACPQESPLDTLACEIRIPDEIMAKPGRYALTVDSSLGSSINYLTFDVAGPYKVLQILPQRIESRIQDLLTIQVSGMSANMPVNVNMTSPCAGMQLPIETAGSDKVLVKLPPECIPHSGCGNIEMEMITPINTVEKISVPYNLN